MKKYFLIKILFVLAGIFVFINFAGAQTVSISPSATQVAPNGNFSLSVNISSVTNLFGVAFDLNFNPSYVNFVNATEGNFLNQGCQTSLMTAENPAGKLIFGITRLGASCGGVSGSGTIATLNFRALNQVGNSALNFSNNSLCILSGSSCNYITGTWNNGSVSITSIIDTTPPAPPGGVTVI